MLTPPTKCATRTLICFWHTEQKANQDKLEAEVEQFFEDDEANTQRDFFAAVDSLKKMTGGDWFMVRSYEEPPDVLATLMSAVCSLMLVEYNWKRAQNLVGSSLHNIQVCPLKYSAPVLGRRLRRVNTKKGAFRGMRIFVDDPNPIFFPCQRRRAPNGRTYLYISWKSLPIARHCSTTIFLTGVA